MYKLIPCLLAATTSCLFFLLSFEHYLRSGWRDAIARESKIMTEPLRINTADAAKQQQYNLTKKETAVSGVRKGRVSYTTSARVVNNRRLYFPTGEFQNKENCSTDLLCRSKQQQYNLTKKETTMSGIGKGRVSYTTSARAVDNRRLYFPQGAFQKKENCSTDDLLCKILQNRPKCSCEKDIGAFYCCERAVLVVHKMGVTAVQSLRDKHFYRGFGRTVQTPEITSHHKFGATFRMLYESPTHNDYRQVVVTRNWYDAIISGYLYHKSGRECWLDWFGKPNHKGWLLKNSLENWEYRILNDDTTIEWNITWNPGHGRDLCTYLIDEPEEVGLRVYTAWAMVMYMNPLLEFRRRRQAQEQGKGWNRTKYICYEELTHPSSHSDALHGMGRWLFPDRQVTFNTTTSQKADKRQADHASDQNPMLRSRLRKIVSTLDAELFGSAIEQGSAIFGCNSVEEKKSNTVSQLKF